MSSPGKDARSENFPVGSWLLSAQLRPHIFIFYEFARAADDIADSPNLSSPEKIRRLDCFEEVLQGGAQDTGDDAPAEKMRESLAATGVTSRHCSALLAAFRQDAVKNRYRNWAELISYCRLSAAPVGRYMIDLHGGPAIGYGPSDALCMALQILNHVQDFGDDFRVLNRIYLPGDWLDDVGVSDEDISAETCSPALRRVLDWTLSGVDALLADTPDLVTTLDSTRLALESSIIIAIALRLRKKLAGTDPLMGHVALGGYELVTSAVTGVLGGANTRLWGR